MIMPGAEPFFYPGVNGKGVLLIHGYTGTPAEVRELGEHLNAEGYTTMGVLLPGHGTIPQDLAELKWQDWYEGAKNAYYELDRCCETVSVIGMSMGSLMALLLASDLPVAKLVIMSTPINLYDKRVPFIEILKHFIHNIPKRLRAVDADPRYNVCYSVLPVCGVEQVCKLIRHIKRNVLAHVEVPCLIMQSKSEHTVKPSSANYLYKHIASDDKQLCWIEHSKHVLTLYEARYRVYAIISDFLKENDNGR